MSKMSLASKVSRKINSHLDQVRININGNYFKVTSENIWRVLLIMETSQSIKIVCSSICPYSISSQSRSVWWSHGRRLGSIAPITLLAIRAFSQKMTCVTTLKVVIGAIATSSSVVPYTLSTCGDPNSPLCHTTLRLSSLSSEIFILVVILFPWCRCTR